MAQLKDLIVNGDAHFGNGATVNGNLQADSYNSRIMLSTTAKPTPSSSGTGIVTENYLAWAMSGGKAQTPATTITKNPTISVATTGVITASYSGSQSITPTVTAGWVSAGTAGTVTTNGSTTSQLTTRNSGSMSVSGATVTAPAGYYAAASTKGVTMEGTYTPTVPATPSGGVYDMGESNTNRYVCVKSWDYLPTTKSAGGMSGYFWAAWNQSEGLGGSFYYVSYTSPSNFRVRTIVYIGTDNRTSGYLDFVGNKIYNYVDDVYASTTMTTSSDASSRSAVNNWVAATSRTASSYLNPGQTVKIPTDVNGTVYLWVLGYYI